MHPPEHWCPSEGVLGSPLPSHGARGSPRLWGCWGVTVAARLSHPPSFGEQLQGTPRQWEGHSGHPRAVRGTPGMSGWARLGCQVMYPVLLGGTPGGSRGGTLGLSGGPPGLSGGTPGLLGATLGLLGAHQRYQGAQEGC